MGLYKIKRDSSGNIKRYKTKFVAKSFTEKEGIDDQETISPISKKDSFKIVMVLVAHFDLELYQTDEKIVFLNGDLEEVVYMCQHKWFHSKKSDT